MLKQLRVERAVIRSHFKRLQLGAIAVGLLAIIGGAPVVLSGLASHGYAVPDFPTGSKLMALLDARSPGEREKGELAATKIKAQKHLAEIKPTQRALGKIFQPKPAAPIGPTEFVQAITPAAPSIAVVPAVGPVTLADVVPPVIAAAPPIGGVSLPVVLGGPGAGGGGTPGTPGTPAAPQIPPTNVTAAVPEPATWLMMLFGFGMIGLATRRQNARLRTSLKAA